RRDARSSASGSKRSGHVRPGRRASRRRTPVADPGDDRGVMRIRFTEVAPHGWNDGVPFPALSTGFARAARATGHRAFYATDGTSRALVLVRSLPLVRWWTARAKVYVATTSPLFVEALVDELRARHVSYVKLGDAVWGLP